MKSVMSFFSKYFVALSFFLFCTFCESYELKDKTIKNLFLSSKSVYRLTVTSGNLNIISSAGGSVDCGMSYQASVVSRLKGEKDKVSFQSFSELKIGGDYLVFFSDENMDAYVNYMSMGKKDKISFDVCNEGNQVYASDFHGMIYEFDGLFTATSNSEVIKRIAQNVDFPTTVKKHIVSVKSDSINRNYLELAYFELLDWKSLESYLITMKQEIQGGRAVDLENMGLKFKE